MKKIIGLLLVVFLLASGVVFAGGQGEKKDAPLKVVIASNQTNVDGPYHIGLIAFKEKVDELSNGTIIVEVHDGTLGTDERELVDKMKMGALDIALISPGFMTKTGIKEVDLLALLYLFDDYDHWERVVDGEVGDKIAELIYEQSNEELKIIGYWTAGVRHYYGKTPVNSLNDLKGLTLRTQTSGAVSEFWKETGAVPSSVAWGELYQALQQKVVDSAENAYPYFVAMKHHLTDNGKYISETGHDFTTRFLIANGKKFAAYSEKQREIILQAAEASVAAERAYLYAMEDEFKQKAISEGAVVNTLDRKPFMDIAIPIQDKWAASMGLTDLLEVIRSEK